MFPVRSAMRKPVTPFRRPFRPRVEALEDRCLPAPLLVTTEADSGQGSLRAAINQANLDAPGDTISFAANVHNIVLQSGLTISQSMTITGPGAATLRVAGNGVTDQAAFSLFTVTAQATAALSGMTITAGVGTAGGGISNAGVLTLQAVSVTGNTSLSTGGGIDNTGTLVITNSSITSNTATTAGGGLHNSGTLIIANTTVAGNTVGSTASNGLNQAQGGGISSDNNLTVRDSSIVNNLAADGTALGGGVYSTGGTNFLINSTVSGNQALATGTEGFSQGGGILLDFGSTMTLTNDTVANNAATGSFGGFGFGFGGGLAVGFSGGTFLLKNTIVARNTATGGSPDVDGAVTSQGHNLIGNTTGLTSGLDPTDQTNVDPQLGPLQNNGGPTQTMALLAGSPAIDAGSNTLATDSNGAPLTTDQRGYNRPVNVTVDIGAFEFQPPATTMTLTGSPNPDPFGQVADFTATVAGVAPGSNTPTGTVTFSDGGTPLATVALQGGVADFTTAALTPGNHVITATFNPDFNFAPNSASVTERVIANSTASLAGAPNPSIFGQPVTFTVTVNPPAAGLPAPTGTVNFTSNGTPLGSATLSGGRATFTTTALQLGSDIVTASYAGDAGYNPSAASVPQRVIGNPVLTFASAPNPSVLGRPAAFALGVAAPAPGLPAPTGTVTFSSGGRTLGTATLIGGTAATVTTIALPLGQNTVIASYSGDSNYNPASASLVQRVVVASGPGVFDPSTGNWFLRTQPSAGTPDAGAFQYGGAGWDPVAGDWDGNGTATAGVVDPTTATWYLRNSNTAGGPDVGPFNFGAPGWIPVAGDWQGTGHTGIGMYDPATATWYLRNEASPGGPDAGVFRFGGPGWTPVVGDWNGDGKTTIGVVNPATGVWYLRNSNSAGPADRAFPFGLPGWTPVAGDWNGTGHAGVGVFDPTTATWYLRNEANAGAPDAAAPFSYGGTITAIPLPPQGGFTAPFDTGVLTFTPAWIPVAGAWVLTPPGGQGLALWADGGPAATPAGAAPLRADQLQAAVSGALARLAAAGVDPAVLGRLAAAHYQVASLGGGELGMTDPATATVWIDASAAGYGWFVDPTPLGDEEFRVGSAGSPLVALPGARAAGRMDLLTAVVHEMGHLAGRPDVAAASHPGDLMADTLDPGARRIEALDRAFAKGTF